MTQTEENIGEPKSSRWQLGREIDPLSLIALILSVLGIGWQLYKAVIGSEITQLDYSDRVVEFRCNSSNAITCWEKDGHLAIILPAFYSNTGSDGYSDVVSRVSLEASIGDRAIEMSANNFWSSTQNSSNSSKPFQPIVVPSRSAAGSELRFITFGADSRILWSEFTDKIIENDQLEISITTTSYVSIENEKIMQTCVVSLGNNHTEKLLERREFYLSATTDKLKKRSPVYVTAVCE